MIFFKKILKKSAENWHKNGEKKPISTITNCYVETAFVRFLTLFFLFFISIQGGFVYAWQHDRAVYELQQGNFGEAQRRLGKLIVEQPDNAAVLYDAGVVSYEQKEYAQAQAYFHNAGIQAQEKHDLLLEERAFFNEGNTHVKLQNLEKAIACYDHVLSKNRNHEQAFHNKKVVEEMLKQQQQQEKQEQKDNSCCNKDNKNEGKNNQNNEQNSQKNDDSQNDNQNGNNDQQKNESSESNKKDSQQGNQAGKNDSKAQDPQKDTGTNPEESKDNNSGQQKEKERQEQKGDQGEGSQKQNKEKEQKGNQGKDQEGSRKKDNLKKDPKQEKSTDSDKKEQASPKKTEENGEDLLGMRPDLAALLKEQEARDKQIQGLIFKEQIEKNNERKGVVHGW